VGDLKKSDLPDPGNIPSKEKHESLAYCLDCDDTRIVNKNGTCITCGSQQIYRNGVAKQLKNARDKYKEEKQHILEEAAKINRVYSREFKRDE
jgi:hypothetical protein